MAKNKQPTVKASTAKSGFSGVNSFNSSIGGFGNSNSTINNGVQSTNTTLSPGLSNINTGAQQGISNNQQYINQDPTQQLQTLQNGGNSYYNLQAEINKRQATRAMADSTHQFSTGGMDNSTARGAFAGEMANQNILTDLATRQSALDYQNQSARSNIGTNAQLMDQIYNYGSGMGQQANQSQYQGVGSSDQMAMFNAQQQQQASASNAELAQKRAAANQAFWGNIISTAGKVAGVALAPVTGGASLAATAALSAASAAKK